MKKWDTPHISTIIIMTFMENPELSLDEFINDCVKCPINLQPRHLLNLYVMCYKRTRNKKNVENFLYNNHWRNVGIK